MTELSKAKDFMNSLREHKPICHRATPHPFAEASDAAPGELYVIVRMSDGRELRGCVLSIVKSWLLLGGSPSDPPTWLNMDMIMTWTPQERRPL